jgi:two-component system response regulator MprA
VLIVGDGNEVRDSLRNLLLVADYGVHLAQSGGEALKLLDRQRVDAAVIDLMMPRLDGVGVVRALLARPEEQRPRVVFVLSAQGEVRAHLHGLSVRRIFPKPFDAIQLVEELGRELRAVEAQGQAQRRSA